MYKPTKLAQFHLMDEIFLKRAEQNFSLGLFQPIIYGRDCSSQICIGVQDTISVYKISISENFVNLDRSWCGSRRLQRERERDQKTTNEIFKFIYKFSFKKNYITTLESLIQFLRFTSAL
jgi:hypothetical protein